MLNPLPARVVARFENLRKTDRHTVYHGTDLRHLPELVNGFDATKMKGRTYNTRPHKGMFVSPELGIAKKFGQVVLELEIPARFLHGRDWAGKPLHPKTQEQAEEMFPDSFRPNLSWMLETGEPQALLLGLVSPRQIRRVFYDGKWYSRKDFLALDWGGLETSRRRPMRDLGVDVSDPSLSWEGFIEATAVLIKAPAARIQKGFDRWIEQGRSPGWVEENLSMWEPLTARRYAERFFGNTQSAARRVASRYREAGILTAPPAMVDAGRYYFIARWGAGVLAEVKKKTRSQKARLRKIQKMLQEQKASIAAAEKAIKAKQTFDLVVYHAPKSGDFTNIRKRKLRYTPGETRTDWSGSWTPWEVDKPFEIHYLEFRDQHNGDYLSNRMDELKEYDEVGPTYLEHVVESVERTLDGLTDFAQSIKQEIAKRKSHANLLSAPNRDHTECEMDLSGWTLWERRITDAAEREIREEALNAKKTLQMKFDPQETGEDPDGGFAAYWSHNKWMVVFAGLSGYWSVEGLLGRQGEVNTRRFKKSLVELDRVVTHEMAHYAQSVLKELLDLPEIAGHPGLSDPSVAGVSGTPAGKEWATWDAEEQRWVDQRIPHELRDVEFEARLGDEIDRFERGLKRVDETLERDASKGNRDPYYAAEMLKDYFDMFTSRSQKRLDVWGADPSAWFAYLRKNDSKRYQAAVAKFTAEMDRRGFMKRLKTKTRLPVVVPNHKAWGKSISRMMPWRDGYEAEKKALQDYARFIDGLSLDQLRRHRTLVRDTGDKEYWVTPRWQDHIKKPLSKEEIEARRTEGARVEHPDIRRKGKSARRVAKRYAFVSNPVIALKNYLTQEDWEKGAEVAGDNEGHFMQWLEENPDLVDDVPALQQAIESGYIDDVWSLPPEALKEYFGEVEHALSGESWSPSWLHMNYEKVMKNQWMIHFTDDAYGVACNGFKYGMDDLTRLGLTTHFNDSAKPGGYNFAYDLNDWERFAGGRWGFKYGKEAVLFKASGVKVWHHSDNEYQVIFVGNTAKDIVPLTEEGYYDGWWANGIGKGGREEQDSEQGDGSFDSLAEAVDWVVANFNQYKKFLTC